jgi:hypothetical protein
MHSGWFHRLIAGAVVGTAGLVLALPGVAVAGGGASGSVEPKVAQRGDDASFFIKCESSSSDASLTGTPLGLPSNIQMDKLDSREFSLDVTIPNNATRGTHHLSMQCSDGSFTEVTLVVSPHGGADTGDGAMSGGTSVIALTAGGVLIVGAGVGGVMLLRRRQVSAPR